MVQVIFQSKIAEQYCLDVAKLQKRDTAELKQIQDVSRQAPLGSLVVPVWQSFWKINENPATYLNISNNERERKSMEIIKNQRKRIKPPHSYG